MKIAIHLDIIQDRFMKHSPKIKGLLEAAGLALYVSLFAVVSQQIQPWLMALNPKPQPMLSIILFLLAFIISAIICGAIIFGYPITLFFDGKKSEALKIVFWSAVWLIIFFVIFAIATLIIIST